jgi:hypothetical protein
MEIRSTDIQITDATLISDRPVYLRRRSSPYFTYEIVVDIRTESVYGRREGKIYKSYDRN